MTTIFARLALLPDGWRENVRIGIASGRIAAVAADCRQSGDEFSARIVIPGLCNAHSHAFQRALAGHTEQRSPANRDNFWSWRERMYRLSALIDAPRLAAIARQAYTEMVASGYTSVCEFHYLHAADATRGDTANGRMYEALSQAARDSGIRLTYIPILYERGGFDDAPLSAEQQRFRLELPAFLDHYRYCSKQAGPDAVVGIGAHSLRAVRAESLQEIATLAAADNVPLHIHIAEQRREVEQSLAIRHRRPVRWLLERHAVNQNWCLVHATHLDAEEVTAVADSGAVVCLCPSTEANLGDGLFPLASYLEQGGRIAIGSDSHVSINPFEELRWLEYGQRLLAEQRNIAALGNRHTGRSLFECAASGGALAAGQSLGRIESSCAADLVVLDDDDPMLAGHDPRTLLDALVFSGYPLPVERVMVAGRWQVIDGQHVNRDAARSAYRQTVAEISATLAEAE